MKTRKIAVIWTIRNLSGQVVARYRALSGDQAMVQFMSDQQVTASQFRRTSVFPRSQFTAAAED